MFYQIDILVAKVISLICVRLMKASAPAHQESLLAFAWARDGPWGFCLFRSFDLSNRSVEVGVRGQIRDTFDIE